MRFQLSEEVQKARERLSVGTIGESIKHDAMAILLECECLGSKSPGYSIVDRALKWCEKEKQLVWRWNRKTSSWHCLADADKPIDLDNRLKRAHKNAERRLVVTSTVKFEELDEINRAKIAVHTVLAGAMVAMSGRRIGQKLLEVVKDPYIPVESALLEACKKRLS